MKTKPAFAKESDLCAAFISALPDEWTAYPETGGFDILLSRNEDGFQIGVEAKLRLNAKVILQAAESMNAPYRLCKPGPDCRAVLVPEANNSELAAICRKLCITVVTYRPPQRGVIRSAIHPQLPRSGEDLYRWLSSDWFELAPAERLILPDWIPDVRAGESAPIALTAWKIGAIKLVITLKKRGFLTRKDFEHFNVSMSRWTHGGWIEMRERGVWIAGKYLPDFRAQHPVNYPQIEADYDKWRNPTAPARQEALL